jgi:hypothetical protein
MAMSQGLTLGFHWTATAGFGLSTCLAAGAAAAEEVAAGCNSGKRGLLEVLLPFVGDAPGASFGRRSARKLSEIGLPLV